MKEDVLNLLHRYLVALGARGAEVGMGVLAAVILVVTLRWQSDFVPSRRARLLALGAVVAAGLLWAWDLRWLSDDAFISFRYARNLVRGHGLVFNLGERVEGYTNFLWVIISALVYAAGLDLPVTALFLGLALSATASVLVWRLGRRLAPELPEVLGLLPVACVLLAANYVWASFSTGGLETMLGAMLATLAIERATADRPLAAGLAGIGAAMSHPDHAIFYAALGAALALERRRWRQLVVYALPFAVVYLPYTLIRWRYYGSFFPNTYYAKAAYLSNYPQGWLYVGISALSGGLWALLPLAGYGLYHARRSLFGRYALIALPLYLTYVAKVGGDYMMGRLLSPALPLLFLAAELGLRRLIAAGRPGAVLAAAVALVPACLRTPVVPPQDQIAYMTDERTNYPVLNLRPLEIGGPTPIRVKLLAKHLSSKGLSLSYAAFAVGLVSWDTDWPIVDIHGLTDPILARQPLEVRGRPGHERTATPEHIIARGAELAAMPVVAKKYAPLTRLVLEGQSYYFTHYLPRVADKIRGVPGVAFTDMPAHLDAYLADIRRKRPAEVGEDLAFFDAYYFKHVSDPKRRQPLALYAAGNYPPN